MNKTGRYARVGAPQRDGDVSVVRALDPVTGLPVRIYRFEGDPTPGAAGFRHPNAARVLEAGRDDEGGYVVAEVIDGAADLNARPGALDVGTAAAAAAALAAAHRSGVAHGDPTSRRVLRRGGDVWLEGLGVPWRAASASDDVRRFASSLLDVPGHALPPAAVAVLHAAVEDETTSATAVARALDDLLGPLPRDDAPDGAPDGPLDEAFDEALDEPLDDGHGVPDGGAPAEPYREPDAVPTDEPEDEPTDEATDGPEDEPADEPEDEPADEAVDEQVAATTGDATAGSIAFAVPAAADEDAFDVGLDDVPEGEEPDADSTQEPSATDGTDPDSSAGAAAMVALDPADGAPPAVVRRRVATHDVGPEPAPPPGATPPRRPDGAARAAPPRPEPPRPPAPRSAAPAQPEARAPQRAPSGTTSPPGHGATPGGFSKTPPPDVTYRVGESPLDERHASGGRTTESPPGVRQRRRTWMLAALLLGALVLAIVTAVARRPVPPPTGALGSVTSIVVDVRIEPASLPPASLVVVASPSGSRLSAGSALGTVPRRVVFDAEGTWQVEARFQNRRSEVVTFRLPDEREVVLRFPPLP